MQMRNDVAEVLAPLGHLKCPYCSGFGHKATKCETGNKIRNVALNNERVRTMFNTCLAPLEEAQRHRSNGNRHARIMCVPIGKIVRRAIRKKNLKNQAVAIDAESDSENEFDDTMDN